MGLKTIDDCKQWPDVLIAGSRNPFDSDSELETSPDGDGECVPYRKDEVRMPLSSHHSAASANLSMQDGEDYAVSKAEEMTVSNLCIEQDKDNYALHKAEETTVALSNCLKIAEDIKEDATNSLVKLHSQGEQITRIHLSASDIDSNLTRGEKLLGSLGGIFSKAWKPKITQPLKGPLFMSDDDSLDRTRTHKDKKEWFDLSFMNSKGKLDAQQRTLETTRQSKIKLEEVKQEDILSNLSNSLDLLKDMATDMGLEINRQSKALDGLHDDVDLLNTRLKGANQRSRHLLRK